MTGATPTTMRRSARSGSQLRLVPTPAGRRPEHESESAAPPCDEASVAQAQVPSQTAHVLVAGSDEHGRSRMLEELRGLLPQSTQFLEACETWQVLARAAGSRMVVLTDDLGDVSAESVVKLLGRRHPTLPVLAVGERAQQASAQSAT
jgi:hypothetical protein